MPEDINAIYTSEKSGSDEFGIGTKEKPFKTILQAMRSAGIEPFPIIYVDSNELDDKFKPASKSQIKKVQKMWTRENFKQADKTMKEASDAEKRQKNLEEAKKVIIAEDMSLPKPTKIKIRDSKDYREKRIVIYGWAHRIRKQGKALMFITVRDGTGFLQCVLSDKLCQTYDAVVLSTESTVKVLGTLIPLPEGKTIYLTTPYCIPCLMINLMAEALGLLSFYMVSYGALSLKQCDMNHKKFL